MLRIFVGLDSRQPVAYHVLSSSIFRHSSKPVAITPLVLDQLPITRRGLTDFTYARFLVPWLCAYEGKALFIDSDMIVTGDMSELFDYPVADVGLVPFQGDLTYERPSLMLFDCGKCTKLTPEYVQDEANILFDFAWARDVSCIPSEWNFLAGYQEPTAITPKLIHYTQGVPGYKECRNVDYADLWHEELKLVNHSISWLEVMGRSKHAPYVLKGLDG